MPFHAWKPRCEEGFSFGFDVGGDTTHSSKTHSENITEILNDNISKAFTSTKTSVTSVVDAGQNINIDQDECVAYFQPIYDKIVEKHGAAQAAAIEGKKGCTSQATVELMKACGEMFTVGPLPNAEDITPCVADGISQEMSIQITSSASVTSSDIQKLKDSLRKEMETTDETEEDALGKALNSLVEEGGEALNSFVNSSADVSIGGTTETSTDDTVIVRNQMTDRVEEVLTEEFVNEVYAEMRLNQDIDISGGITKNVSQKMGAVMVSQITSNSEKFNEIIKDVEDVEKTITTKKLKGVTDIAEEVADTAQVGIEEGAGVANNVVDETGETSRELGGKFLDNMSTGMILIAVGVIAFLILMGFMWSSGGSEIAADAAKR